MHRCLEHTASQPNTLSSSELRERPYLEISVGERLQEMPPHIHAGMCKHIQSHAYHTETHRQTFWICGRLRQEDRCELEVNTGY